MDVHPADLETLRDLVGRLRPCERHGRSRQLPRFEAWFQSFSSCAVHPTVFAAAHQPGCGTS